LAEFGSAVDALTAAIEFQQTVDDTNRELADQQRFIFRVGLHLGDLIVDGDDLYGAGVERGCAARGPSAGRRHPDLAQVRDAVAGRVKATFEDLGGLSLKNIERPVRAFRVGWDPAAC
jgi:class 3 adenylate cyclase